MFSIAVGLQEARELSPAHLLSWVLFPKTYLVAVKHWFRGPRHRLVATPDFLLEEKYEFPLLLNTSNPTECYHYQTLLFQQGLPSINCILFLFTKVLHSTYYLSGTVLRSSTLINSIL